MALAARHPPTRALPPPRPRAPGQAVALAASLAATGALPPTLAGASVLALVPAVLGMVLGRLVLRRVSPPVFRICFLVGLAALGLHLALRG